MSIQVIEGGSITSPQGFQAGAVYAGIKTAGEGKKDLGLLYSQIPCLAAGVFTQNKVKAAPVLVCQDHLRDGRAQAIVVNSGCANGCTGPEGLQDAYDMARLAAAKLGLAPGDVLVASTGVIGVRLPMHQVSQGITAIALSTAGGHDLAHAITTTDTFAKGTAVSVEVAGGRFVVGGIAKGAGMIHPDMATLLAFLSTDARVAPDFLRASLQEAVDASFNMVTVDGDTSTNDTAIILANGLAGGEAITADNPLAFAFQRALTQVCQHLAQCIARDGEGATKLIEVTVEGAMNLDEARLAARTVAGSSLVKAAIYGNDPNWGRILAAVGRSGAEVLESKVDLYLSDFCLMKAGTPQPFDREAASESMKGDKVCIRIDLHLGAGRATAWGCDLTEEYVTFNSAYTT